ncbi:hypothetical protein AAG906_005469 [Vitis piasezkii]
MVTQRGIEVNLGQVKVVFKAPTPNNKKELQRLTGRLAALGHFIVRFTNKLRPFFLILKGQACSARWTNVSRHLEQSRVISLNHPS